VKSKGQNKLVSFDFFFLSNLLILLYTFIFLSFSLNDV